MSGKYIKAIGRRKTSVAQVRMYEKGDGEIIVNDGPAIDYFKKEENLNIILQPLKLVSKVKDFNFSIIVKGGGTLGQLEAVRHGIARALVKYDPEFKTILKTSGYITRDPRQKERKKPGLKKARKAPQWSKR
ncbi:MAG TPA: 30S ribosomal protein S9 [bacterium]|nr:30S ribosomal protein S9 [bacterium]